MGEVTLTLAGAVKDAVEIAGDGFGVITGNAILMTAVGFGFLKAGIGIFKKAKKAAR